MHNVKHEKHQLLGSTNVYKITDTNNHMNMFNSYAECNKDISGCCPEGLEQFVCQVSH